jgi:hypothetical protein
MKKNKLVLALMLVLTFALSTFADGETHSGNLTDHSTDGGYSEVFCQICDALTGSTHP